jgi:hypothetical protein
MTDELTISKWFFDFSVNTAGGIVGGAIGGSLVLLMTGVLKKIRNINNRVGNLIVSVDSHTKVMEKTSAELKQNIDIAEKEIKIILENKKHT